MSLLEDKVDNAVASQQTPTIADKADPSAPSPSGGQQSDQIVEPPPSTVPSVSDGLEEIDVGPLPNSREELRAVRSSSFVLPF